MVRRLSFALGTVAAWALAASIALAGAGSPLPWGMTWETGAVDYVRLLQEETGATEYSILEYTGGGVYSIAQSVEKGDWATAYSAEFTGDVTSKKITEHTLADIADRHLRMNWLCITVWPIPRVQTSQPLTNGDALTAFAALYGQFQPQYGDFTPDFSYVTVTDHEGETWYRLPEINGAVDFEPIGRWIQAHISSMETLWLVLGNGSASCRLYATRSTNAAGDACWLWNASYYFTREQQPAISSRAQDLR